MLDDPFEKRIYSHIAWKALQENATLNPTANEVIANNAGIRCYRRIHPPLRADGIHPYIQCRRQCIYSVVPHPEPVYQEFPYDLSFQGSWFERQPKSKGLRPSTITTTRLEENAPVTDIVKSVVSKTIPLDENHYCAVFSAVGFPLLGDCSTKRIFDYWKYYDYDIEVSAKIELDQAWAEVTSLQKEYAERQDAKLKKCLEREDRTNMDTKLFSSVFYPWTWSWKPEKPKEYTKKVLLKFDTTKLENLLKAKNETSESDEFPFLI